MLWHKESRINISEILINDFAFILFLWSEKFSRKYGGRERFLN